DVTFKILPHQASYFKGFKKERLSHTKLYKVYPDRMRAWEWGFKRLTDFIVSVMLLILSLPFLLVAIIASRINIGGKIFVKERCFGLNRQEITIPKFRVSKSQTEFMGTSGYNITPETFWGRFLRMSRFERMPMLFPVLLGKMSLVGPEPVLTDEKMNSVSEHPNYDMRFLVKPGLISNYPARLSTANHTGLSELKLEWDLKYLESMSTLTDFKIIIKSTMGIWTKILSIGAVNQCWI
ncbi:MAG: hypothetical protein GF315_11570, partial [candidate division Zixibacteria bacterium]|nr:hypothetical protein [candidate division Zixibacteria bacterium]